MVKTNNQRRSSVMRNSRQIDFSHFRKTNYLRSLIPKADYPLLSKRGIFQLLVLIALTLVVAKSSSGQEGMPSSESWPIVRGNRSLHGVSPVRLPESPKLLWTYKTGDNIKASPVVGDGKVVIGSTDGSVYCLDTRGTLIWKYETPNAIEAPALIHNGTVYAGNMDGSFYALRLNDGSLVWEYKADNQIVGSANVWMSDGKAHLLVGSYDYYLHCIDAVTGKALWKYESDNFINGAPAVTGDVTLFGGCDGFLHVVDIATGKARKKIDVATYVPGSPVVEGSAAYLGDYDGRLFRVDTGKETVVWEWTDTTTTLPFIASPALHNNRIYAANHNKFLYCFDAASGKKIWEFNTGSRVEASPVVAGNQVLVANMRGDIVLVRTSDGTKTWSYEIGSQIIGNPAVAGKKIFVGALDGNLYCFGE